MIFRISRYFIEEKECSLCGKRSREISSIIGVCGECLRENPNEALKIAMEGHRRSRGRYGLPPEPPRDPKGVKCSLCANQCQIPEGGFGFCGLVKSVNGKLVRLAGTPDKGLVEWYYDPLPTNCVAEWTCPGCTGIGYPKYAYMPSAERGYYNLAVFYGACNLDCLFCQNWQYRNMTASVNPLYSAEELARAAHSKVSCVCYFGGDPSPQMQHAIKASEIMLEKCKNRIFRVCWETNGLMNPYFLDKAVELSLKSGGLVKFDIKSVNICASAQHLKEIPVFTKFLEKKGLKVTVGQAPFLSPGQVIGCDYRALVPSDAYIVIAGGLFHGIGVKLLRPSKPVVVFDPYTRTLRDIEKISKKLLTLHLFNLTKALEAKNFGILVSLKSGQNRLTLAHHIKKLLEKHELKAEIITFYNITKEKLENIYWYDTFINTACPRITVENQTLIRTPIINANEVKYILEKSLASFRTEHLIQLPPKHICTKQLLEI